MDVKIIELQNGLRVLYRQVPYTSTVHCGYIIDTGSRDDGEHEAGMAHFIEHMIFKGTARRKTFHILNYLESVGGDVNAYTTKEKIALHASLMATYFERATELLTDITFHSTFPEREIVKEKQVISEEIDMYRNAPDEAILEDFDAQIFPGHSLGRPILGTKDSIGSFTQEAVLAHLRRSFTQGHVVYSIVGNVSEKEVRRVVDKYLAGLVLPHGDIPRTGPATVLTYDHIEVKIPTDQVHEIVGGRAYGLNEKNYVAFLLLNNLLGGPAMNSRLNLNIREKYGLAYSIYSFYSPFLDTGMWGIYYACERNNLERIRRLVERELRDLRETPLGFVRLNQAKKQLIGQMALSSESLLSQMLSYAKDLLDFGRLYTLEEHIDSIEGLTSADLQDTAAELFHESPRALITYLAS
ncbi:MAG: pitrilysin family protein [Bacteroidia bacterium]